MTRKTSKATKPKKKPSEPRPIGRPSPYDPSYCQQAEEQCANGATDKDLADFFGVCERTIYRWAHVYPDFLQALKAGKACADERVVRSLYHKAVGYRHEAVKIFLPAGATQPIYAPYVEQVPPDTTAMIFWLKNRRPDLWRDRQQHEHSGPDGAPIPIGPSLEDLAAGIASKLAGIAAKKPK